MREELGHRLKMARHAKNVRQCAVATAAKISQKHLSQIERGHVQLSSLAGGAVRRLARALGVTTDYLLGMDVPEHLLNGERDPASDDAHR